MVETVDMKDVNDRVVELAKLYAETGRSASSIEHIMLTATLHLIAHAERQTALLEQIAAALQARAGDGK